MAEIPFGKYRLVELLGRGGMGDVWRAYDTVIDRTVAIKILPAEFSTDEVFQQRFRREAHAATRLNSPHVIPIHTHGEIDGRLFVDMRLIEGRDLQSMLANGPPLAPARAVHIIEQVAKALHAAHRVGLLHRDVKPSNILLDDDDFAYLIDFGIARAAGELALTTAGDVVGTFHYMAPERFSSNQADTRSDIYALTCVLYECLTRRYPFPGNTPEQQVTAHLRTPPPRPTSTNPRLPVGFDMVIAKGMAKNPGQRYATTTELARAAREAVSRPIARPQPTVAAPPPASARAGAYPRRDSPSQNYPGSSTFQPQPSDAPSVKGRQPSNQQSSTTTTTPPSGPWWRRKSVMMSAVVLVVVAATVAAVSLATGGGSGPSGSNRATLPFADLSDPEGLSVDNGGTVYVADTPNNQVLALPRGSTAQAALPFTGLTDPGGVTVDGEGAVYVTDRGHNRVLKMPAGSTTQVELPFTGLDYPWGLAVDTMGIVYVAGHNNKVVTLRQQ